MKKLTVIASVLLIAGAAKGGKLTFEKVTKAKGLPGVILEKGDVSIVRNNGSKVLRLTSPKSLLVLKSGVESKELDVQVDWLRKKGAAGTIIQLTDNNRKNKFLSVISDHASVRASSFSGSKMKMRTLFESEVDTWYRFKVSVTGRKYSVTVIDRGPDNSSDDAEVVYSSIEKRKKFRVNRKSVPTRFVFNQWVTKDGMIFDYDNLDIKPGR